MLDAFARIISQANAEGVFLNSSQLEALTKLIAQGKTRLDVTTCISENAPAIIAATTRTLLIEQPYPTTSGNAVYHNRRMAACVRDLEIILRYVTYALLAGDVDVLDERCLNGLRETYQALNVPLDSVAKAIEIMRAITTEIIIQKLSLDENDIIRELSSYFKHIINSLGNVSNANNDIIRKLSSYLKQLVNSFVDIFNANHDKSFIESEDLEIQNNPKDQTNSIYISWEPNTFEEWRDRDKLVQKIEQYSNVEDSTLFEESALDFFESWKQMPKEIRHRAWREREVMAALYEKMIVEWKDIKGFRSIAVAERIVEHETTLAGILIFDSPTSEDYYQLFNLPKQIRVQSLIHLTEKEENIPLLLEWMTAPVAYSGDVVETDTETAVETIILQLHPPIQSGDPIAGCNETGRVSSERAVTLTTFVIPKNKTHADDIRILTVNHGFQPGYFIVHSCIKNPSVKIGEVDYTSPIQKELAQKLDVAIIKPVTPLETYPFLKWIDIIPKPPVILTRGMLVQMHGGVSGHQTGYIDYSGFMDFGPVSSVVPHFTALIPSQPGDSGSLLVIGDENGNPFTASTLEGYTDEYLEKVRFAMAGMLVGGTTVGQYPNMTVFRPISTVFQQLKVRAAYPQFKPSLSTETL